MELTSSRQLPYGHILVMRAAVLHRILPASDAELDTFRLEMESRLDAVIEFGRQSSSVSLPSDSFLIYLCTIDSSSIYIHSSA